MMRVRRLPEGPQAAPSASAIFSRSLLHAVVGGTSVRELERVSLCHAVLDKGRGMTDHACMDGAGEWQKAWTQRTLRAVLTVGRA